MRKISILSIVTLILINILSITINTFNIQNLDFNNNIINTDIVNSIDIYLDKKNFNSNIEVDYYSLPSQGNLLSGLIANEGNTKDGYIIQTKGDYDLKIVIISKMIDFNSSYYIEGTVDNDNNFHENFNTKKIVTKDFVIKKEGIYHLHLVNDQYSYDSYLEIGRSNWKIKGVFNNENLKKIAAKLNVTINLTDLIKKQEAMGWLESYQTYVDLTFEKEVTTFGKGFDLSINNDFANNATWFLVHSQYSDYQQPYFYFLDLSKLDKGILQKANKKIQDALDDLPSLKVDYRNVISKETLEQFTVWIYKYDNFCKQNIDRWINNIVKIAARGFANHQQIEVITNHLDKLGYYPFLKQIIWTPYINDDYQDFILIDKWQHYAIDWVKKHMPTINEQYKSAIRVAESGLNLHGYNIDQILNDKQLPRTKNEIEHFADGQSFHNWLQTRADNMYHLWQLTIGLGISLPLLAIIILFGFVCYRKFSYRHNPIKGAFRNWKNMSNIKKSKHKKNKSKK